MDQPLVEGIDPTDRRRDVPPARPLSPELCCTFSDAHELRRSILGPAVPMQLQTSASDEEACILADGKVCDAEPLLVGAMEGSAKIRDSRHPGRGRRSGVLWVCSTTRRGGSRKLRISSTRACEAHLALEVRTIRRQSM